MDGEIEMTRKDLSKKEAAGYFLAVLVGLVAWLYLTSLAGIFIYTLSTGEFVIRADRLMLGESIILFAASIWIAFIVIRSLSALVSQIRRREGIDRYQNQVRL